MLMEDNRSECVLRSFEHGPVTVRVIEEQLKENDEPTKLVEILVTEEDGEIDKMLTICGCHAKEIARNLKKAARLANSPW